MPNQNCLEGMACPKCGSEGPYRILCHAVFEVDDDGTGDCEDVEWGSQDYCHCKVCDYSGTVSDFRIANQKQQTKDEGEVE